MEKVLAGFPVAEMVVHFRLVVQGALLQVFVGLASWVMAAVAVHGARIQEGDRCRDHQHKQERSNQIICNRSCYNSKEFNNKCHKYSRLPNRRNYSSNNKYNSQSDLNNHSDNHSDNHNNCNNRR